MCAARRKGLVYAVLVGINRYRGPLPGLAGCVNDVEDAATYLRTLVEDRLRLLILRDETATRGAVVTGIRRHLGQAGPDDAALFWFSGHGSEAPVAEEFWHLEPTGMHQTLVCADSRHDGVPDLTDKELSVLFDAVAGRGAHVAVVLDCCHSGGGTRDPELGCRGVPAAPTAVPADAYISELRTLPVDRADPSTHVALSACRSFEKAREQMIGEQVRGAFSTALLSALRSYGPDATYRTLHRVARWRVEDLVVRQSPVIYPVLPRSIADEPFLGGVVRRPPEFSLSNVRGRWQVDAGWCHGVSLPADGKADLSTPSGPLVVVAVRPGSCEVRPDGWSPDEDTQYPVMINDGSISPVSVQVGGTADDDPAVCARLEEALRAHRGTTRLVAPGEPSAGLRLTITATSANGRPVMRILHTDGSYALEDADDRVTVVAAQVDQIARWTRLKDLDNPGSSLTGLVRLELVTAAPGETIAPRSGRTIPLNEAGEVELSYRRSGHGWQPPKVFIRIQNESTRRLWCVLLTLTDRYGCDSALFPGAFIAAGGTGVAAAGKPIPVRLPASRPVEPGATVRDWCKLLVADEEINALGFQLPPIDRAGEVEASAGLRARLRDSGSSAIPSRVSDWSTVSVPVVTRVPQ